MGQPNAVKRGTWLGALALALVIAACGSRGPAPSDDGGTAYPAGRFDDYKPHAWENGGPDRYRIHGIDVARYQGTIDWPEVRRAGISFAYIKATEGGDMVDPKFEENWRNARRAGIPRGAYHFYYFCRSAEEQARWFIQNVPRDPQALPPVLDMEWNPFSPTCTTRPPAAVVRSEAQIFVRMIEQHYGKRPVIYTALDFYEDTYIGRLRRVDFWLRSVAGEPHITYPGQDWKIWQYTGTGSVPGVTGPVDINVFRDGPAAFADWAG
ncbi:glycoside hydrolase family 25 protein [Marinibacterium profundimaris]|uniref:glycoside hydrolase family 25 protein n=1 Tax=Marinibacterium profundimaris TaxID=1679460 RepID=UPI000B52332C|nr:GH25 family lysozyme [Marinibacterium profundimaris]